MHGDGTRGNREKLEHCKFWLDIRSFFTRRAFKHHGTRAQRGCGISILGDVQASSGHSPEQPDLIRLGFEQQAGLDGHWRSPSRLNYSLSLWPMDVVVQWMRETECQKKNREVREKGRGKKSCNSQNKNWRKNQQGKGKCWCCSDTLRKKLSVEKQGVILEINDYNVHFYNILKYLKKYYSLKML